MKRYQINQVSDQDEFCANCGYPMTGTDFCVMVEDSICCSDCCAWVERHRLDREAAHLDECERRGRLARQMGLSADPPYPKGSVEASVWKLAFFGLR